MNKVIFDNKCPFCSSINNRLERLDLLNLFLWVPSDKYMQSDNIHPSINKQIINKSIIVLNNRNNIMSKNILRSFRKVQISDTNVLGV